MGSIASGLQDLGAEFFGGSEREAGRVQARAAKSAEQLQREQLAESARQFDIAREQLSPFLQAGTGALTEEQALIGLLGPEAQQEAYARFTESPGQAFLRQRQEQALMRNAAAMGGLGGGRVREALQEQATGFAQQDFQNQLQRISALRASGQTAASTTGQQIAQQAQMAQRGAQDIAQLRLYGGQARAGGILGSAAQNRAMQEQFYQRNMEIWGEISNMMGGMYGGGMG